MNGVFSQSIDDDTAELRKAGEAALDELTAALTMVFKAANKLHRVVDRLDARSGQSSSDNGSNNDE